MTGPIRILPFLAALLLPFAAHAQAAAPLDIAGSTLLWRASKMTGEHAGGLTVKKGLLTADGGLLLAADITVDMTTITCTDITNAGSNKRLVDHLRSADFFHVEEHPEAVFRTTRVEALEAAPGKPNFRVTGDLVIKGISHPNTFDCLVWRDGGVLRAAARLVFDRTKYDIRYRSGVFFPDLGDKMIHDEVSLTFDIRTVQP